MNWQDHSQLWAAAHQHIINSWGTIFNSAFSTTQPSFMGAWQEMVQQGIRLLTHESDPTARAVAEKMFASQLGMMRLLELFFKIWGEVAPIINAGGDWQTALEQQMGLLRRELNTLAAQELHLTGSFSELWQTYLAENKPWLGTKNEAGKTLMDMTSMYWDAYRETMGSILQLPSRDLEEKMRLGFAAWLDMQQAMYQYNLILADTWVKAFDKLIQDLAALATQGEKIDSVAGFLSRWSATADEVFKDVFRSDDYVKVQGKLVNTVMSYRQQQQTITQLSLQMWDIPTRGEIDEAHRRIQELRREVKALRRELNSLKRQPGG